MVPYEVIARNAPVMNGDNPQRLLSHMCLKNTPFLRKGWGVSQKIFFFNLVGSHQY